MNRLVQPSEIADFIDEPLLTECLKAFDEGRGGVDATLNLSTDFDAEVKAATSDQPRVGEYRSDRGPLGMVGGRTVRRPDGTIEVYINLRALPEVENPESVIAMFRHEGFHSAIEARNESLWSRVKDGEGPHGGPHAHYFQAAAIACDEYRVEAGNTRHEGGVGGFLDFARSCEALIAVASAVYEYEDQDVGKAWASVTEPFNALVVQAGYLAAECSRDPSITIPHEGLLVTRECVELLACLQRLPKAAEPAEEDQLNAVLVEAAEIVERWMQAAGFAVEDTNEGLYFHVRKPEAWINRGVELAKAAQEDSGLGGHMEIP